MSPTILAWLWGMRQIWYTSTGMYDGKGQLPWNIYIPNVRLLRSSNFRSRCSFLKFCSSQLERLRTSIWSKLSEHLVRTQPHRPNNALFWARWNMSTKRAWGVHQTHRQRFFTWSPKQTSIHHCSWTTLRKLPSCKCRPRLSLTDGLSAKETGNESLIELSHSTHLIPVSQSHGLTN